MSRRPLRPTHIPILPKFPTIFTENAHHPESESPMQHLSGRIRQRIQRPRNDGRPHPSALQTTPHTSAFPTLSPPPQAHNKSRSPPLFHMPLLDEIVSSLRIPSRPRFPRRRSTDIVPSR